ncbi:hypothetical protein N9R54_00905 [Pelobium sp.]|nr:hypothetical protein [Pelobium sp.]MDA9554769.1 hypothetical protein [Pelobium sp.]
MKLINALLIGLLFSACTSIKPANHWLAKQEISKNLKPQVFDDVNLK